MVGGPLFVGPDCVFQRSRLACRASLVFSPCPSPRLHGALQNAGFRHAIGELTGAIKVISLAVTVVVVIITVVVVVYRSFTSTRPDGRVNSTISRL